MRFVSRPLRAALLAGAVVLAALPAEAAPELDQQQETSNNAFSPSSGAVIWQTFTPGVTGKLTSIELLASKFPCIMPPCIPGADLDVAIVATTGGLPDGTVLATGTVPLAEVNLPEWKSVALTPTADVTAATLYAIRLTSTGMGGGMMSDSISTAFMSSGNPYGGGEVFSDLNAGDGLDDPENTTFPGADLAFRTYVDSVVCGDNVQAPEEECEDGNTAEGDGCNAACEVEECGNLVRDAGEECDDGNTVEGDGCDAACELEPSVAACQAAIAKAGYRLVSGTLAAIQKCRTSLAQGKTLSVDDAAECASETSAAKSIAKAREQARKYIAEGKKPKCTNAMVALLDACADTVDDLIGTGAETGCLLTEHDAAVATALDAEYGY
jgi:cysteine-rich repeat protein